MKYVPWLLLLVWTACGLALALTHPGLGAAYLIGSVLSRYIMTTSKYVTSNGSED